MIAYRIGLVAQSARRCCRVLGPVANSRTSAINLLADRQIRGPEFDYYRNWLCCTVVHASRAGPLDDGSPDIISRAHNVVREAAAPHADVPADHDEVLDSLRQFDALAGIVFLADPAGSGSPSYGPGFARYTHRGGRDRRDGPAGRLPVRRLGRPRHQP